MDESALPEHASSLPPQASSSATLSAKRPRAADMDADADARSKRIRSEQSFDEIQTVAALLEADDDNAVDRDEPMDVEGSSTSLPHADKGKQRMRDAPLAPSAPQGHPPDRGDTRNAQVVIELETELSCACCAGLVHRPMILQPCQHFFCASCLKLWIQNANSNTCPQCRTPSTHATASRTIQSIVDLLTRNRPDLQRSENERKQADEICPPVAEIKMPQPRPPNPDLLIPQSRAHDPSADNLARPCPHCIPQNQFGWQCPRPIADPEADPDHAWNLDDGPPPGHGFCGACSEIHPLNAPGTTACSLCRTSFCGLSIPHLCVAPSVRSSRLPQSLNTLTGLLEAHSESIWEAMEFNDVEIVVLLDWLREGRYGAIRTVYQEMLEHVKNSPEGFEPLIRAGVFQSDQVNINPLPVDPAAAVSADPSSAPATAGAGPSSSTRTASALQATSSMTSEAEVHNTLIGRLIATADIPPSARAAVTSRLEFLSGTEPAHFLRQHAHLLPGPEGDASGSGLNAAPGSNAGVVGAGANATGSGRHEGPSAPVRVRVSDLRFLFGLEDASANMSAIANAAAEAAGPSAPGPSVTMGGIPADVESRLIRPLVPTSNSANVPAGAEPSEPAWAPAAAESATSLSLPSSSPASSGAAQPSTSNSNPTTSSTVAALPTASNNISPSTSSGTNVSSTVGATSANGGNASADATVVTRVCRDCAFELFLHELYPWWARERLRVLALMAANPLPAPAPTSPITSPAASQTTASQSGAALGIPAPEPSAPGSTTEAAQLATSGGASGSASNETNAPAALPISEAAAQANFDLLMASVGAVPVASASSTSASGSGAVGTGAASHPLLLDEPDGEGDGEPEDGEGDGEGDGAADEDSDEDEYIASRALRLGGGHHRQIGGMASDVIVTGSTSSSSALQLQRLVARLPEWVGGRADCPDGKECRRQRDVAHAKEFNHIIVPAVSQPAAPTGASSSASALVEPAAQTDTRTGDALPITASTRLEASQGSEVDRVEQMDVDAVNNQLNAPSSSAPASSSHPADDSFSSLDTVMHDGTDTADDNDTSNAEGSSHASSSRSAGPQIAPVETNLSGPIITPSADLELGEIGTRAHPEPAFKHQAPATTSEVLMDVALIRNGIAPDPSSVHTESSSSGSNSSFAIPTVSEAPHPAVNVLNHLGPSVEMVTHSQ